MSRVIDIRLVLERDDALVVRVDGRRVVGLPSSNDAAAVLAALARGVESAAWTSARSTMDELADAGSVLYQEQAR